MPVSKEPGLRFIIVGASIAGLTSALALKASGHSVLVLEKEPHLAEAEMTSSGGARLSPNGCKVLFDWGLENEVRENAVVGEGFMMYPYEPKGKESGPDYFGLSIWDHELLMEARGDFLLMRMAIGSSDHSFQRGSHRHRCTTCAVTLRSGENHSADAIIGADGASGIVRKCLMKENTNPARDDALTGLAVYSTIIPKSIAIKDEGLAKIYDYPQSNMVTILMGNNRGAKVFLAGKERDVLLWVYTPDGSQDGSWNERAERHIGEVVGSCDPLLQKLVAHAGPSTCVQIKDHCELDSWVSRSGNVLVLGEAAHPSPPTGAHTCSVAIEDGVFIGKIFSHTRDSDRIPEFFYAFEENRKPRCAFILQAEKNHVGFITLPDGHKQISRDATMRANHAAGRNVLDVPEAGDILGMWDELRKIFDYDPMDAADECSRCETATHPLASSARRKRDELTTNTVQMQILRANNDSHYALGEKAASHTLPAGLPDFKNSRSFRATPRKKTLRRDGHRDEIINAADTELAPTNNLLLRHILRITRIAEDVHEEEADLADVGAGFLNGID
ncbi:hypothetical protein B0H13DRAFT_2289250 [Mycena leptocephala]|nr:hypothetical protein B0H13DRAFT_2289250 [Mycena leptocephala]